MMVPCVTELFHPQSPNTDSTPICLQVLTPMQRARGAIECYPYNQDVFAIVDCIAMQASTHLCSACCAATHHKLRLFIFPCLWAVSIGGSCARSKGSIDEVFMHTR